MTLRLFAEMFWEKALKRNTLLIILFGVTMVSLQETTATPNPMGQTVHTKIKGTFLTRLVLMCLTTLGVVITLVCLLMDRRGQVRVTL